MCEIRKVSYKEIVKEKEKQIDFIKLILQICGIPKSLLEISPELTFKTTDKRTGEKILISIPKEDYKEFL